MAGKRDGVFPFTNRGVDIKTKEVVSVRACVCVCEILHAKIFYKFDLNQVHFNFQSSKIPFSLALSFLGV